MKSNLSDWNSEDVIYWLKNEAGITNFDPNIIKENELDGKDLLDLTEENLKNDLKINRLHDRKLIMRKICELIKLILNEPIIKDINKTLTVTYKGRSVAFLCDNNCKVEYIINECLEIFDEMSNSGILIDSYDRVIPRGSAVNDNIADKEVLRLVINSCKSGNEESGLEKDRQVTPVGKGSNINYYNYDLKGYDIPGYADTALKNRHYVNNERKILKDKVKPADSFYKYNLNDKNRTIDIESKCRNDYNKNKVKQSFNSRNLSNNLSLDFDLRNKNKLNERKTNFNEYNSKVLSKSKFLKFLNV